MPVAHQSIVEKQYKKLTINASGILKCSTFNAGLIIRVQGDCIIHGTIDQSGLAPKTNSQNNYPYPAQLVSGNGGTGASGYSQSGSTGGQGGIPMNKRSYGGGYGSGGGGGSGRNVRDGSILADGGDGGDSAYISINISSIFTGGAGGMFVNTSPQHLALMVILAVAAVAVAPELAEGHPQPVAMAQAAPGQQEQMERTPVPEEVQENPLALVAVPVIMVVVYYCYM